MARPGGLQGRKVKWSELIPGHDDRVFRYKEVTGYIIDFNWVGEICYCIICARDGLLLTKKSTELTITGDIATELPATSEFVPNKTK